MLLNPLISADLPLHTLADNKQSTAHVDPKSAQDDQNEPKNALTKQEAFVWSMKARGDTNNSPHEIHVRQKLKLFIRDYVELFRVHIRGLPEASSQQLWTWLMQR